MKIAAFFENIAEGAEKSGISAEEAVKNLMNDGLELLYLSGISYEKDPENFKALLRNTGAGVEGMYMFFDFVDHPEDTSYERLVDVTKELGGTNVLLLPGVLPQGTPDRDRKMQNMFTALARAVEYGEQKGIAVSMEDFDGMEAPYSSIDGLDQFMQAVPGLKCSFDTGNFCMYSEDELEAFERFKDRLCTMHLKDRSRTKRNQDDKGKTCADGSVVYAEMTGYGYIRMEEILRRLKEMSYPGNVIVEMYDYSPQHMLEGIAQSVRWVKEHK